MNLNIIIKDLLKEHPEGGEKFFDALDLLIRGDSDILSMFLDFVMNNLSENITYGVVLSGKFGCVLYNNYGHILSKYFDGGIILTNGGIRKGEPAYLGVTELSCTNYVFLDDSYYSGKTKSGIEEALKNIDSKAKITNTFVVNNKILIVTGREGTPEIIEATKNWLINNNIPYDFIYLRPVKDYSPGAECKKEIYNNYIKGKYNVSFVLEDNKKCVNMWRSEGLICLQPNDGNF